MPINDFKPFAAGPGANVTSQADWENLPALLSGFMSGKASSAQMNKAFRQASFIAAALAQFVSEKTDQDVLDDGDLPGFVEKLTAGFAAQYLSRSNPFGDIASDGEEAIATALSNLGLDIALAGKQDKTSQLSIFATGSDAQILKLLGLDTALAGKQPLDATLTNLSNKTVTQLLAYLGLAPAGNTSGNLALIGDTKNLADKCAVITKTGSNANGKYRVWSDGTIEMWGDGIANMNGDALVTYPMTLPAKAQYVGAASAALSSNSGRPTTTVMCVTDLTTTTKATFIVKRSDGTTSADGFYWSVKYAVF